MSKFKFSRKSLNNLAGVHPDLVRVVHRALEISASDFIVIEGVRTLEAQRINVAKGYSRTMNSKHLKQADGHGHAVDIYPFINGRWLNDWTVNWLSAAESKQAWADKTEAMKQAAAELEIKIKWGGDWFKFVDGPHYELVK